MSRFRISFDTSDVQSKNPDKIHANNIAHYTTMENDASLKKSVSNGIIFLPEEYNGTG